MSKPTLASIEDQSYQRAENDLIQEYRLGTLHSFYRKYFKAVLALCGWDLFDIYRDNRERRRALLAPELRISSSSSDKSRKRTWIAVVIIMYYLIVRLQIVGLVKMTDAILIDVYVFNSTRLQSLSSSAQARLNAFLSPNLVRYIMPSCYQTLIQQVMKLGLSVKEPYDSIAVATDLVEFILTVLLFYLYVVVPLTNAKNPLNASTQRFMLDPLREISRIDLSIKRHLHNLIHEGSKSLLARGQSDQVASFRPHTFSVEWYRSLYRFSLFISLIVVTEVSVSIFAFFYALYDIVLRDLCAINGLVDCGYHTVFTINDLIYFIEILTATSGVTLGFSFLGMVIICTNTITQLTMVRAINDDLNRCLSILRSSNVISADMYLFAYDRNRSLGESQNSIRWRLVDSGRLLGNFSREQEVELCLLRTYLKLVVALEEVRQIAHFVGRLVETNLAIIGYIIITIFINYIYNDFKIHITRVVLFISSFFLTNPLMLICSYAFARTVELEKVAWSILAELTIYQELAQRKGNPRSCKSSEHIEVLARRWRKLVQSYALSSQHNASKPFGLSMTYGQLINIDFFVISIALVVMKR